jgi:uncharacterized membrane protein HdeD (DUF308 family)
MARKVGQIIARGDRRWLIRVYLGRDRETNKRNYHNRTIHGPSHTTLALRSTLCPSIDEASMTQQSPSDIVRHASTWSILCGVALIVLGVLAVASPALAAVAVNAVISWLIVLAGVVHLSLAFYAHKAGSVLWKLLVGLAYAFFGVYLIAHPSLGVVSLTLVLASLFLLEGIFDIALFFQMRAIGGSGWILADGIITLALGLMIYLQWPSSSNWAIGTLVGVSLIISGVTRLMLSLAVRKAAADLASLSPGKAA